MMINGYILDWLDLLWVPVALLFVQKGQRLKAVLFVLACVFALRLQVELMRDLGFEYGFFKLIDYPALLRGYITYGVFVGTFLALACWSRERSPYVFMAAAITVFITAFCVSTFIMVL